MAIEFFFKKYFVFVSNYNWKFYVFKIQILLKNLAFVIRAG